MTPPPYPAAEFANYIVQANDGKQYASRKAASGKFKWVREEDRSKRDETLLPKPLPAHEHPIRPMKKREPMKKRIAKKRTTSSKRAHVVNQKKRNLQKQFVPDVSNYYTVITPLIEARAMMPDANRQHSSLEPVSSLPQQVDERQRDMNVQRLTSQQQIEIMVSMKKLEANLFMFTRMNDMYKAFSTTPLPSLPEIKNNPAIPSFATRFVHRYLDYILNSVARLKSSNGLTSFQKNRLDELVRWLSRGQHDTSSLLIATKSLLQIFLDPSFDIQFVDIMTELSELEAVATTGVTSFYTSFIDTWEKLASIDMQHKT